MEDQKISKVISVTTEPDGNIKVILTIDPKKFAESFAPLYEIKQEITKIIVPILSKEILEESKETIKKEVLEKVNWAELVRSEVVQKTLKDIVNKY